MTIRTRSTRRTPGVALAAAAVGLLALTGCSPSANQETTRSADGSGDVACPVAPDTSFTGTLRLGYQLIPNGDLVVKDARVLETCLPGATIQWSKFSSGSEVLQAFGSRSLDIATLGSSPATKALSDPLDLPVRVLWIHDVIGAAESLAVRDTSVNDLAGLRGRKIGVPFASTSHYSLLAALQRAGLAGQVELVNLQPDAILGAWQRGEIDAAWVWEPTLGELLQDGKLLVSGAQTAEQGAPTFDVSIATTEFLTAHPEVARVWAAAQNWAVERLTSDPEGAARSAAGELGIPADQVATQFTGYRYLDAATQAGPEYLGGGLADDLLKTADFLHSQGEVAQVATADHYREGVSPEAARAAG